MIQHMNMPIHMWYWSQPFAVPLCLRNVQSPHFLFPEGPKQANSKLYLVNPNNPILFRGSLVPHKMQNANYFGMAECEIPKFSGLCLVPSKMQNLLPS